MSPPFYIDIDRSNVYQTFFSRPMARAPAPFVFINGWPGAAKEAVAECIALLMGSNKAMLIDVHQLQKGVARSNSTIVHSSSSHSRHRSTSHSSQSQHQRSRRRANTSPISNVMTPEHPEYDPSFRNGDRLARLLSKPANTSRLAILVDCAPDIPSGRAAVRAYEAAALQTGRMFVSVTLEDSSNGYESHNLEDYGYAYGYGLEEMPEDSLGGTGSVGAGMAMMLPLGSGSLGAYDASKLCVAGTARDARLELDIQPAQAHEAAMTIVEFVNALVIRRDVELCSAVTTPMECREPEWRQD